MDEFGRRKAADTGCMMALMYGADVNYQISSVVDCHQWRLGKRASSTDHGGLFVSILTEVPAGCSSQLDF
jgi:hypothetical protein